MSACGQHIECMTDGACTVLVACLVGIREASALPTWAPDTPTRFATQPASFPRRPESSGSRLVRARVRTGTIIRASWGAESVNFSGSWHRIVPHGAPPTRGTSGSGSAACAGGRGAAWAWPTGMKKGPHRRSDAALRMWFVLFARVRARLPAHGHPSAPAESVSIFRQASTRLALFARARSRVRADPPPWGS